MRVGPTVAQNDVTQSAFQDATIPSQGTDTVEEGFFTVDHDLRIVYVETVPNGQFWSISATPLSIQGGQDVSWVGQNLWEIFTGSFRPPLFAAYKRLLRGDRSLVWEAYHGDLRYIFRTFSIDIGYATYYRIVPHTVADQAGTDATEVFRDVPTWSGTNTDDFFLYSADIMCILDEQGHIERANPAAERFFGQGRLGRRNTLFELIHPEERESAERLLSAPMAVLAKGQLEAPLALRARCQGLDGEYRWLQWSIAAATRKNRRFYATARDVTVIIAREEEMTRQVQHDPLTGLPNRNLLADRLHFCLAAASRRRHSVAVLFLDLDRFKKINDTFGHPAGDQLLRDVADRMRTCLRDEDMVARLGGDEFVVILPQVRDTHDAIRVAEKLLSRFVQPFQIRGNQVMLSVSIGISLSPQDGSTADELVQHADEAMYRAKDTGHGCYSLYDASLSRPNRPIVSMEEFDLHARLSLAIQREELLLHYQPQVDLKRGRVIGVEALMRWHPSATEQISPATFIPLAEETNLIVPMGTWAVHEACRQAVDWYRSGFPVQMSVNLSAAQLADRQFPEKLYDYLNHVGLPPTLMDLELTERTFIHNDEKMIEVLNRLRDLGIHLSVDDFGTKYSWLPYLRNFPIDGVKVDRSFVTSIADNSADEAVVKAIIDLSHTLGLKVIAEGVETTAQRDCLLHLGCDVMQGHLFSAAVPPHEVAPMLRQGRH